MRFGLRPTLLVIAAAMMVLSFSIVASAGASSSAPPKPGPAGKPPKPEKPAKLVQLQLLSFNDYHGTLEPPAGTDATLGAALDPSNTLVGGAAFLATELNELRA